MIQLSFKSVLKRRPLEDQKIVAMTDANMSGAFRKGSLSKDPVLAAPVADVADTSHDDVIIYWKTHFPILSR